MRAVTRVYYLCVVESLLNRRGAVLRPIMDQVVHVYRRIYLSIVAVEGNGRGCLN